MAAPTWSVGQVLTASDVNSWFVPIVAYKTAATGPRTSTTVSNDPDLSIALAASAFYEMRGCLIYQAAASATIGMKWQFTTPSGIAGGFSVTLLAANYGYVWTQTAIICGQNDNQVYSAQFQGIAQTSSTSGSLTLQWAANTGATAGITLGAGSYLLARRVG